MSESRLVKDPICGKEVDTLRARAVGIFGGVTYYFCSLACKEQYVDPRREQTAPPHPLRRKTDTKLEAAEPALPEPDAPEFTITAEPSESTVIHGTAEVPAARHAEPQVVEPSVVVAAEPELVAAARSRFEGGVEARPQPILRELSGAVVKIELASPSSARLEEAVAPRRRWPLFAVLLVLLGGLALIALLLR